MVQWVTYGVIIILLLLVFFLYLMARQAFRGFKQGMNEGGGKR